MPELSINDFFSILKIIASFLRFLGIAIIVPALVALIYGEILYAEIFIYMSAVLISAFSLAHYLLRKQEVRTKHAIIAIALGWFIVGLISAIPFTFWEMKLVDAYFESISGWSTTGLTMIEYPEKLPYALNFWRGYIQWLGGFGIVVMALILYEKPKTAHELFKAEGRPENFYLNVSQIARIIVGIYSLYTLLGIFLFMVSGMNLFEATVHSFTTIATGGFSTRSQGIGYYGFWALVSTILIMLAGGISFVSHRELLKGNIKGFLINPEIRLLFGILLISTIVLFIASLSTGIFFDHFFYSVSALTGTGATAQKSVNELHTFAVFIIILLMISGACYGSTAGAIKLWRILIVFKVIRREIYKGLLPQNAILPLRVGDKTLSEENALNALAYIALYVALFMAGSIIFMLSGYSARNSLFVVASAQGNVGLNVISGQAWYDMNVALKILLSFHMILGRMEIIPFLILLRSFFAIKRV